MPSQHQSWNRLICHMWVFIFYFIFCSGNGQLVKLQKTNIKKKIVVHILPSLECSWQLAMKSIVTPIICNLIIIVGKLLPNSSRHKYILRFGSNMYRSPSLTRYVLGSARGSIFPASYNHFMWHRDLRPMIGGYTFEY